MLDIRIKKDSKYGVLYNTPSNIRYILLYGGRAAGRSFQGSRSAAINIGIKNYYRGFLMRNILDTVRDSIYQDCLDRIGELDLPVVSVESNLLLRYGENQLKGRGFKKSSGADTAKNKSVAGVNTVFIEEAEEVSYEDFMQLDLSLRTVKGQVTIILMFNPPVKGHWILKEWFHLEPSAEYEGYFVMVPRLDRNDTAYRFATYHENIVNLDVNVVSRMERLKETNLDYYLHKIMGLVPSGKTGRVFKQFSIIPKAQYDSLELTSYFGLDFGYSNDPTACIEVKAHNNNLYICQRLYQPGLTNPQIYEKLEWIKDKITADSSEPKSIAELSDQGLYIVGAKKGTDSVNNGIQKIQQYNIYITDDSTQTIDEFENYSWRLDKNKEPTDKPEDKYNHAIDALRYAVEELTDPTPTFHEPIYF